MVKSLKSLKAKKAALARWEAEERDKEAEDKQKEARAKTFKQHINRIRRRNILVVKKDQSGIKEELEGRKDHLKQMLEAVGRVKWQEERPMMLKEWKQRIEKRHMCGICGRMYYKKLLQVHFRNVHPNYRKYARKYCKVANHKFGPIEPFWCQTYCYYDRARTPNWMSLPTHYHIQSLYQNVIHLRLASRILLQGLKVPITLRECTWYLLRRAHQEDVQRLRLTDIPRIQEMRMHKEAHSERLAEIRNQNPQLFYLHDEAEKLQNQRTKSEHRGGGTGTQAQQKRQTSSETQNTKSSKDTKKIKGGKNICSTRSTRAMTAKQKQGNEVNTIPQQVQK